MKKIDIFVNPIDKSISNNRNISFDKLDNDGETAIEKINNIFNDENKTYRTRCEITHNNNSKQIYIIIGRTQNSLVTIDKNIIRINDIKNIKII